jgi:hypothetical protein
MDRDDVMNFSAAVATAPDWMSPALARPSGDGLARSARLLDRPRALIETPRRHEARARALRSLPPGVAPDAVGAIRRALPG